MFKTKLIIPLITLLLVTNGFAYQPDTLWTGFYGTDIYDEYLSACIRVNNGGYLLIGEQITNDYLNEVFVVSISPEGEQQWYRTFGGDSWDEGFDAVNTNNGFLILTRSRSFNEHERNQAYVFHVNSDGDSLTSWGYDPDFISYPRSVIYTLDGGYAICGFGGGSNISFIKLTSDFREDWSRQYNYQNGTDDCWSIVLTSDSGFALGCHSTWGAPEGRDFLLIKTDEGGEVEWTNTFGGDSTEFCYDVIQTQDGGYMLVGVTLSFGAGGSDFYVVKTDPDGEEEWSRTYGWREDDQCTGVIQNEDGDYVLCGFSDRRYNDLHTQFLTVIRIDEEGNQIWEYLHGYRYDNYAWSIMQTEDGGYAVAGSCDPWRDNYNFWLVRLNTDIIRWFPSPPDTSLMENDSLVIDTEYFEDYLSPSVYADSLLSFEVIPGEHLDGYQERLNGNSLIIKSERDWFGIDTLRLVVSDADDSTNADTTSIVIEVFEDTGISEPGESLPTGYSLNCYPNPFNGSTIMSFSLLEQKDVSISILNLNGQLVTEAINGTLDAGNYELTWDAGSLPSGLYLCRLEVGNLHLTQKLILIR